MDHPCLPAEELCPPSGRYKGFEGSSQAFLRRVPARVSRRVLQGLGNRFSGVSGFRVWSLGIRVPASFRVQGLFRFTEQSFVFLGLAVKLAE